MTDQRFLIEVEDQYGVARRIVDAAELTDEIRAVLEPLVADLTPQERLLMVAQLVRDEADHAAYRRVCERQGLLL